jgi:putative transposase
MLRAYKYRIYPNAEQQEVLAKTFGCVRLIYNSGLETKNTAYRMRGVSLSCFDLIKQMKEAKDDMPFLSEVPSQALQMALRNLDNAFTNFFRHGAAFPRFKAKHRKQSFQLPQGVKCDFVDNKIFIPKCKWVDCIFSRRFEGKIKTTTVSRTPTGKYFVSILVDLPIRPAKPKPVDRSTAVGLDLGIKNFLITSEGEVFENQKYLTRNLKRLRVEQRSLARKQKDSANRDKQRLVVAKLHEKIANQRKDFLQKVSTELVQQYDTICMEDLHVKGMIKNHKLARSIGEQGWSMFKNFMQYKCETYGKHFIQIGRFEPSSKMCSVCGTTNHNLSLKDREWTCHSCSTIHDRDINAAINIRDFGCRAAPLSANVEGLASCVG